MARVWAKAPHRIETQGMFPIGDFLGRDQRVYVAKKSGRLNRVDFSSFRLNDDVEARGRLPVPVEAGLPLDTTVPAIHHVKPQQASQMVDEVLECPVVLVPRL